MASRIEWRFLVDRRSLISRDPIQGGGWQVNSQPADDIEALYLSNTIIQRYKNTYKKHFDSVTSASISHIEQASEYIESDRLIICFAPM